MAVTEKQKALMEEERETLKTKEVKESKLDKKLKKALKKLNSKDVYAFFGDEDNKTHHNLLTFLTLIEKRCKKRYGKTKKSKPYSKKKVFWVLRELWDEPTERQVKTLNAINRHIQKKDEKAKYAEFRIKGLFKGKDYKKALENYDEEKASKEKENE